VNYKPLKPLSPPLPSILTPDMAWIDFTNGLNEWTYDRRVMWVDY
jgi:hypothetical protein